MTSESTLSFQWHSKIEKHNQRRFSRKDTDWETMLKLGKGLKQRIPSIVYILINSNNSSIGYGTINGLITVRTK